MSCGNCQALGMVCGIDVGCESWKITDLPSSPVPSTSFASSSITRTTRPSATSSVFSSSFFTAPSSFSEPRKACRNCQRFRMKCEWSFQRAFNNAQVVGCDLCESKDISCSSKRASGGGSASRHSTSTRLGPFEQYDASTGRPRLSPSRTETRLADLDTAGMVGASLLLLFNTTGNLYPLPAYDFFALEERFNRAGGRLSSMSTSDQATCRIVFALASSLSTEHAIADPSFLSQELAEQAQSFIDFVDISRWSPLDNAINLLLLWQSVCRGEIGSDVGQPFLVAVVEQLSRVHETDPPLLRSPARGFSSCLVYHAMLYDAAAAVERGTKPKFTPLAYHRILDVQEIAMDAPLPSLEDVKVALRSGPWPAVQAIIHAVASYFVASRRLAYFLAALDDGELGGDDMKELQEIWIVLEQSAKWGSDLCDAAAEPGAIDYDPGILSPVLHFSYAASIFAQLAALKHLQRRGFDRNFALSYHRSSCLKNICRLVRDVRTPSSVNSLLSSTGTLWSVSSLVAFAELFCSSHAWDRELHPGGPGDKLASLNYLITTLSKVISMYRPTGSAATTTLRALEMDRVAIKSMLGLRTLANPSSSSNRLPPSPYTSLSEINNWLHRLDINPPDSSSSPPFAFSPPPRSSVAPSVPPYFASPARDGDETASSPLVPFPLPLPQSSSLHRPSSAAFPPASSSSRPSALSFPVQTIPSPSFPFGA